MPSFEGKHGSLSEHVDKCPLQYLHQQTQHPKLQGRALPPPSTHFIALVDVVIYHLKQKPHHIPQDERGDQVPVDNISQALDAPEQGNTLKLTHPVNTHTHTHTDRNNSVKQSTLFCSLHALSPSSPSLTL